MTTDAELAAAYIRENGVTRCPTAILNETTAELSAEDRAVHVARGLDPIGDLWRAKMKERGKTGWGVFWARKKALKEHKAREGISHGAV